MIPSRSTLFCKSTSARFTALCGCSLSHEAGPPFVASLVPCDDHYQAGMEPMELTSRREDSVSASLGCGCCLSHMRDGPTRVILCSDDLDEYVAVLERRGFIAPASPEVVP